MLLYQEKAINVLVIAFDLWLDLSPFQGNNHKGFEFLGDPALYNNDLVKNIETETGKDFVVYPFSKNFRMKNIFWKTYNDIHPAYTLWERQEPYRVALPFRINSFDLIDGIRIRPYAEALLFPSGFSNIFKFKIEGALPVKDLPGVVSQSLSEQLFSGKNIYNLFDDSFNYIKLHIYGDALYPPARMVFNRQQKIVAIQDRYYTPPHEEYTDMDWELVFSVIMAKRSIGQNKARNLYNGHSMKIPDNSGCATYATGLYDFGVFLDMPDKKKRTVQCRERNLQNHIIMVNLLAESINDALLSIQNNHTGEDKLRQLVSRNRVLLQGLSEKYNLRMARHYIQNNKKVMDAIRDANIYLNKP